MTANHEPRQTPKALTTSVLWPILVIMGVFAFINTHPIRPHDYWWHLAAGREIVASGQLPAGTASQNAASASYTSYQTYWLAEILMYCVHVLGGSALAVIVHSVTVTTAYCLTLWLSYRQTRDWRSSAFATLFAAALGFNDWNVRPQAAVFWIAPAFLLAIHAYKQNPRRWLLAVFPIGMAIWANCHGTLVLGLVIVGLWLVDTTWTTLRHYPTEIAAWRQHLRGPIVALSTASMATLLNPRGLGIITYVTTLTSNPVIQNLVPEWKPPAFSNLHGGLFLVGLLFCSVTMMISPERPRAAQVAAFVCFGALGLKTSRGVIWFGLMMAPTLSQHLAHIARHLQLYRLAEPAPTKLTRYLNGLLLGILGVLGLLSLPWLKPYLPMVPEKANLVSSETPISATEFLLTEELPGPVFHSISFGSYLIWAAQPQYPVFVDPRIELYSEELWYDYIHVSSAQPGWEGKLRDYAIRTLMLSRQEQPRLIEAAEASQAWVTAYADNTAVILISATDG